jgi:hypothetical protein
MRPDTGDNRLNANQRHLMAAVASVRTWIPSIWNHIHLSDENNEKGADHGKDGSRQEVDIHGVYGWGQ